MGKVKTEIYNLSVDNCLEKRDQFTVFIPPVTLCTSVGITKLRRTTRDRTRD